MLPDEDFPYIKKDSNGYRYNGIYPPDKKKYGINYDGYPNNSRQVLFYDFAVLGYDVEFKYKGDAYYLLFEQDHASLCDNNFSKEYLSFSNPMELIENLIIDGHHLIDIIDEWEDAEAQ